MAKSLDPVDRGRPERSVDEPFALESWPVAPTRARARSEGSDLKERRTEGSIPQSVHRSDRSFRSARLTSSELRLVRWLEAYVPVSAVSKYGARAVQREDELVGNGGTFYRARPFVRRHGVGVILEALSDMFIYEQPEDGGRVYRCWRQEIKSPARMLNFSVAELVEEAARRNRPL